jgi:hypothetical protein
MALWPFVSLALGKLKLQKIFGTDYTDCTVFRINGGQRKFFMMEKNTNLTLMVRLLAIINI